MKFFYICLLASHVTFSVQKVLYDPIPEAGFFASFLMTLGNVIWYDRRNQPLGVYWGKKSLYYQPDNYQGTQNVWEYYFEPIQIGSSKIDKICHLSSDRAPGGFQVMGFCSDICRDPEYRR